MKKAIFVSLFCWFGVMTFPPASIAQTDNDAVKVEINELLNQFLKGASVNDAEMHDRFWDEELIYTGSNGQRITKADIMQGLEEPAGSEPTPNYHAEDVVIRVFENTAVLTFRLVAETGFEALNFYNSGVFVQRPDGWRVINWQATKIPQ